MMCAMARNLGTSLRLDRSRPVTVAGAPAAVRSTRPSWRDPRLWIGVALVAVSVIAGARIMAGADRTVGVWAVSDDLAAGATVADADLVVRRVHFASGGLGAYFPADRPVPSGLAAVREVGAGELLPRAALGPASRSDTVQVPIAVDPAQVPRSVGKGSVVDVYVVAGAATGGAGDSSQAAAKPALSGVSVVAAPPLADSFGASGKRQLDLAVPKDQVTAFFALVQSTPSGTITVVRR